MGFIAPIASATLGLRRAHHGLRLLGITMVIWAIEAGVWMSTGAAVGFGMTPIEGLYIVALASIFAMIPSGPAYAGTQDAAAIIGIKALGGTSAQAVAYVVMLRFVIVVPITLAGLALLVTPLRRPGQAADGPCLSSPSARPRRRRGRAAAAALARRADRLGRAAWRVALALRLIDLGARPFHHDESQDAYFSWLFQTSGDYAYDPLLHGPLRFYLTAAVYTLFGDSDFTARLAPGADGHLDGRA